MSEFTTMTMAAHRLVGIESLHPARAMAYELALQKRQAGRARRWRWRTRVSLAARREAALDSGC